MISFRKIRRQKNFSFVKGVSKMAHLVILQPILFRHL